MYGRYVIRRVVVLAVVGGLLAAQAAQATVCERAADAYANLWRKADRYYGAEGAPPPLAYVTTEYPIRPGVAAVVAVDQSGTRAVFMRPWFMRTLGAYGVPLKVYRERLKGLLHEWAHIFQTDAVLANEIGREWAASGFAKNRAQRIVSPRGKRVWRPLSPWLARGQFGENWGADPRTLTASSLDVLPRSTRSPCMNLGDRRGG